MSYVQLNMSKLTLEQKANKQIMQSAPTGVREIFLDAPAGTGKTYIITLTVAAIRSLNVIALALPSSGIVGILIQVEELHIPPLKLPSNMQFIETRTCNISKTPGMWKLHAGCTYVYLLYGMNAQWHTKISLDHCKICVKTSDHLEMQ